MKLDPYPNKYNFLVHKHTYARARAPHDTQRTATTSHRRQTTISMRFDSLYVLNKNLEYRQVQYTDVRYHIDDRIPQGNTRK